MRRSINRRAILHHHRRVRWFSTVDLVNALELEKAAGKQGQIAHRAYKGLGDLEYPLHDRTITVTRCGRICVGRRKINLSAVFAGQNVGIKEGSEKIWLVSFMHYDLGFFDHEAGASNAPKTRSMLRCYLCLRRYKPLPMCPERTLLSWCRLRDSNPRPTVYKTVALPLC